MCVRIFAKGYNKYKNKRKDKEREGKEERERGERYT
jgi:hypothetical protein